MAQKDITLVFTDVVGSSASKRAAGLGADIDARDRAYLDAIQTEHLRVVRSAVEKYRGKEIMTMGDGFFLTFDDPVDALRCAAAIHQRLRANPIDTPSGPLRLRVGIHAGTPKFFENSWHGTDVDIASRAQSIARPQQVIVTDAARKLMGEPAGIKFQSLGTFALKGVGDVDLWDADYDGRGRHRAARLSRQQNRTIVAAAMAFNVVMLGVAAWNGAWFSAKPQKPATAAATPAIPVGAPSSIIVADFENKTGDPVFDTTLTQAFIIQLQQSPVITVVSPQHLRQSMKFLGKSPDDPLTPAAAQEIGVREGDKAYVTGGISKFGDAYLITVSAVNPATGDNIASEQAQAADKDHILEALSTVSTSMRNKLGESLASIQKLDTPLGQATTPSLDAFRAFALGDVAHYAGREIPDAEGHYKQALEIDPNFAVVWARLGTVYNNSGQNGKALDCYTRAFKLSKNASEGERWYIEEKYYGYVIGDVQKTIDILELACQTYPLDWGERLNLGVLQGSIGRMEAALENVQAALKLSPDSAIAQQATIASLAGMDRYDEAKSVLENWKKLGASDTSFLTISYDLHLLTGDTAGMAQDIADAVGRDDEFQMTGTVAVCQEFEGKYAEAEESYKRAVSQAAAQKAGDAQAFILLTRLTGRGIAGIAGDNAGQQIKAALALDQSKPTLVSATIAALVCHQPALAQPFVEQLAHDYPQDTMIQQLLLPSYRAGLALSAHQPQAALHELEGLESFDAVTGIPYVQGLAYLELHDGPHAVACFRRATKYRGAALLNILQNYAQAQLGLARAYTMSGDSASAKKAYEAFFTTWKDADENLPQLVAAKKEYADLLRM